MNTYEIDVAEYEAYLAWKTDGKARLQESLATMGRDDGNDYLDVLSDQGPMFTEKMLS